jgi:hypothetical protein
VDLGLYIRYNIFIVHDVTGYTSRTLLKSFKEEKVKGPYIQQTISPLVNLLTRLFNTGPNVFLREESIPTKKFTARQWQGLQIRISTLNSVSLRVSQSNRFLTVLVSCSWALGVGIGFTSCSGNLSKYEYSPL